MIPRVRSVGTGIYTVSAFSQKIESNTKSYLYIHQIKHQELYVVAQTHSLHLGGGERRV